MNSQLQLVEESADVRRVPPRWRAFLPEWLRALIWVEQGTSFDAFLSYGWKGESSLGLVLQSVLQMFLRPWYKTRALNIFRDLSSLAPSGSLQAYLERKLDQSRHLIVLASSTPRVLKEWSWRHGTGLVGSEQGLCWSLSPSPEHARASHWTQRTVDQCGVVLSRSAGCLGRRTADLRCTALSPAGTLSAELDQATLFVLQGLNVYPHDDGREAFTELGSLSVKWNWGLTPISGPRFSTVISAAKLDDNGPPAKTGKAVNACISGG